MNHHQRQLIIFAIIAVLGLLLGSATEVYAWYDSNYSYRRELTIESSKVSTTTNGAFVIVASTTQTFLKDTGSGGKIEQGMGYDIIFVDNDDSTLLNYEYESYSSSTGSLVAWIEVADGVSSTSDQTIYMYYGYASASDNATSGATWANSDAVGVWHMDNSTATDSYMYDSTNNSNDGTFTNTDASDQVSGPLDGSFDFDGSNDYVEINYDSSLDITNQITMTAWVKIDSDTSWHGIINSYDYDVCGWFLGITDARTIDITLYHPSREAWAAGALLIGPWYHVAATYNGSQVKIYQDGALANQWNETGAISNCGASVPIYIGAQQYDSSSYFDGIISEVRLYDTALTPADITTIYNMENDNSTFLTFGSEEDGPVSGQFTISAWVRPTNSVASTSIAVKDDEIRLLTDSSGQPACLIHNGTAWQTGATSSAALSLNQWSYVSCTYDRSNIKLYVDGVLQVTQSMSNVDINNSSNALEIGRDASSAYNSFQGYIDEFKYYKYARTAAQIKSDYGGGGGTPRGTSGRSVTVGESQDPSEGLVAYWKMDETFWNGSSNEVVDSSGNVLHGTAQADATTTATAKYGRAGTFDGTGDYVQVSDDSKLDITSAITIEAWAKDPPTSWYNSNYKYRRELTIESSKVSTTTNGAFVIVASTTQTFLKDTGSGGKIEQGMGYDIIFVDNDDSTLLNYEYESYSSSTGSLVAWIEVADGLSSTSDQTIYMYYGYASASDNATSGATWSGTAIDPTGVWHLSETPTVDSYAYDSTNNDNNGTFDATMTTADQVSGELDGSIDFDGTDDWIQISDDDALDPGSGDFTFMFWVNVGATNADRTFSHGSTDNLTIRNNADDWEVYLDDSNSNIISYPDFITNITTDDSIWHHVILILDRVNDEARGYYDGIHDTTVDISSLTGAISPTGDFEIAKISSTYWAGKFDEIRMYKSALTQADITTMYNMESDNASFLTFGSEEDGPYKGIVSKGNDAYALKMSVDGTTLYGYINSTLISATVSSPTIWHHYALTYNGSTQYLYIDGENVASNALTGAISANATNLLIGENFTGEIDDVKIYNVARSANQIRMDYERPPYPMMHLKFDEKQGDSAYDTSGSNDGTLGSGAGADSADPTWTQGKYGSGLEFDGVDDYVEIPDFDYQ